MKWFLVEFELNFRDMLLIYARQLTSMIAEIPAGIRTSIEVLSSSKYRNITIWLNVLHNVVRNDNPT